MTTDTLDLTTPTAPLPLYAAIPDSATRAIVVIQKCWRQRVHPGGDPAAGHQGLPRGRAPHVLPERGRPRRLRRGGHPRLHHGGDARIWTRSRPARRWAGFASSRPTSPRSPPPRLASRRRCATRWSRRAGQQRLARLRPRPRRLEHHLYAAHLRREPLRHAQHDRGPQPIHGCGPPGADRQRLVRLRVPPRSAPEPAAAARRPLPRPRPPPLVHGQLRVGQVGGAPPDQAVRARPRAVGHQRERRGPGCD
jgi:hypothetical protein